MTDQESKTKSEVEEIIQEEQEDKTGKHTCSRSRTRAEDRG